MESNIKKPTLVYNQYGKPQLDVKEVNNYMYHTFMEAFKSISKEDLVKYRKLVEEQKKMEKKELEFNNNFLNELRKKAKPLSQEVLDYIEEESKKPISDNPTLLSTVDTSSLKIEID
jgi:vacuolar-type H+-ATPase subunit B/Vma2